MTFFSSQAKNQTFVCELCGKEYQSSTGLKHHKKTCGSSAGGSSGVSKVQFSVNIVCTVTASR